MLIRGNQLSSINETHKRIANKMYAELVKPTMATKVSIEIFNEYIAERKKSSVNDGED